MLFILYHMRKRYPHNNIDGKEPIHRGAIAKSAFSEMYIVIQDQFQPQHRIHVWEAPVSQNGPDRQRNAYQHIELYAPSGFCSETWRQVSKCHSSTARTLVTLTTLRCSLGKR
jgi:hypothetical protein